MKKLLDLIDAEQRKYTQDYINAESAKEKKRISERILTLDIILYKAVQLQIEDEGNYNELLDDFYSILGELNSYNNLTEYVQVDTEALINRLYDLVESAIDSLRLYHSSYKEVL